MAKNLPPHIQIPSLKYDGTTDPVDHPVVFENWMNLYNAPEVVRCKLFPITFQGAAIKWYRSYRMGTIYS